MDRRAAREHDRSACQGGHHPHRNPVHGALFLVGGRQGGSGGGASMLIARIDTLGNVKRFPPIEGDWPEGRR